MDEQVTGRELGGPRANDQPANRARLIFAALVLGVVLMLVAAGGILALAALG